VSGVPFAAQERIGQDLVGLLDTEESVAIAAIGVGMEALGQPPVSGLNVRIGGVPSHAESAVRVECLGHLAARPASAEL
jgi:hypothetical protein